MPDLVVLSLGAGVQSTTLLRMALDGDLPKPDAAIFADTRWEPAAVYEHLAQLEQDAAAGGIPVHRVSVGDLRAEALDPDRHRWASMPLWVRNGDGETGLLRRQCTKEYKIAPIRAKIRELLGGPVRGRTVELWFGISFDEASRSRDSDVRWLKYVYPLLDRRMTRADCLVWLRDNGFPEPPKSACIGCPFHDNAYWSRLKADSPREFQDAVEFDRRIRSLHPRLAGETYLHRSLVPLDQVKLPDPGKQLTLDDGSFLDECQGMCGN